MKSFTLRNLLGPVTALLLALGPVMAMEARAADNDPPAGSSSGSDRDCRSNDTCDDSAQSGDNAQPGDSGSSDHNGDSSSSSPRDEPPKRRCSDGSPKKADQRDKNCK